jgi:hypothetical protein
MHATLAETPFSQGTTNMLVKRIYASWDAKDPNSVEIIKELGALPDKWLKDRKNHWERCTFKSNLPRRRSSTSALSRN